MYNNREFVGQRPMKRPRSPSSDASPMTFRGGYRGGHHPFAKRHRGDREYQAPLTIEERITRLGDTGSRDTEIGILAKDIYGHLAPTLGAVDDPKIKSLSAHICKCIISFPTRIATYATLIGLISIKHYNLSCQVIDTLCTSYTTYLEAQKWTESLTITHFLATLVNCNVIERSEIISQFRVMLDEVNKEDIPQERSDYYTYAVLSTLPYVASELSQKAEDLNEILQTIESYLAKRTKDHLNAIRVWSSEQSTTQMDYLDSLWVQTKNFRANNWNETYLHRPYNEKDYKDNLSSLVPRNPPIIQIPPHCPTNKYPGPRIVFRIFEDDVTEGDREIPGSDRIERFCIENQIRMMLAEIPRETRNCARHLSTMVRHETLPMKHLVIETVLGELFTLPNTKYPEIIYQSLLHELFKIFQLDSKDPKNFETILNQAVNVLYSNLDAMNATCFNRFIEWFSYYLNTINFLHTWVAWSDAAASDPMSPKTRFVREILARCTRFTFHKKMSKLIGPALEPLMPPEPNLKYNPIYKDHPRKEELTTTISDLIKEKANGAAICQKLNIVIEGALLPEGFVPTEEKHSDNLLKIDLFTAVILDLASKSLTHLSSALGKYKNVFKALIKVEGGQIQMLDTMHSCLEDHPQLIVILIDKLIKAELIEAKEVCRWLLSESMKPNLHRCYPWEILRNTVNRLAIKAKKLTNQKLSEPGPTIKSEPGEDVDMRTDDDSDLELKIEQAEKAVTDLLMLVSESIVQILRDHMNRSAASGADYNDHWFKWILGCLQHVIYSNFDLLSKESQSIRSIMDKVPEVDVPFLKLLN